MKTLFVLLTLVTTIAAPAVDAGNAPNCKLVIQTKFKSGKKRVEVTDVHADSRNACREEARARELASVLDDEIEKIRVTFGWREPAL